MAVDVPTFRKDFIEFNDVKRYPNSMVNLRLTVGAKLVNAARWGDLTDFGVELFAAHHLSLWRRAMDESDRGSPPGQSVGIVNNKSVDKVSVGYDTTAASEADAGHWNMTNYGKEFIRLARMMGTGGLQVGVSLSELFDEVGAWPGPWQSQFPNMNG